MIVQFKNEHIFFAIEPLWEGSANIDFKYQLRQAIIAHPENDYVQEMEIPESILIQMFSCATVQPEGVAASINKLMLEDLVAQLEPLSNLENEEEEPNEAARILVAMNKIKETNLSVREGKIERGKNLILNS